MSCSNFTNSHLVTSPSQKPINLRSLPIYSSKITLETSSIRVQNHLILRITAFLTKFFRFRRKIKKKEKAGEIEIVLQWQVSVIDVFYIVGVFIAIVSSKLMYDA